MADKIPDDIIYAMIDDVREQLANAESLLELKDAAIDLKHLIDLLEEEDEDE